MKARILGVGMKVRTKGAFYGIEGVVTSIRRGYNIENHGTVEFRVTRKFPPRDFGQGTSGAARALFWSWVRVGDLEHFVFYGWPETLEVVR